MDTNTKNALSLSAAIDDLRQQIHALRTELESHKSQLAMANVQLEAAKTDIIILKVRTLGSGATVR